MALPDGLTEPLGEGVLDGVVDDVPDDVPADVLDDVAVGLGVGEPEGLGDPLDDGLPDGLDELEGPVLVLAPGEPLGLALLLPVGVPLGPALSPGLGEPVAPPGVDGPCSASMTARICCSKSVSLAWIWSSGTEPMSCPKVTASAQISSMRAVDSALSGPSRVTKSCTAAENVRQLVQS